MRVPASLPVRVLTSLLAVSIFCAGGCSDSANSTYPVRGIVRFPDGQVLREGSVEFEIQGVESPVTARGVIGPDGSFVLGTYKLDDGARAGTHRVVVIADYVIGSGAERPGLIPKSTLPEKYRSFDKSGLVQEVKREANNVVIDVEYADRGGESDEADRDKPGR